MIIRLIQTVLCIGIVMAVTWVESRIFAQTSAPATLTEIDQLRIEKVNLLQQLTTALSEADTCRGLLADPRLRANRALVADELVKLKAAIERAHPGYTWDLLSGTLSPAPAKEH